MSLHQDSFRTGVHDISISFGPSGWLKGPTCPINAFRVASPPSSWTRSSGPTPRSPRPLAMTARPRRPTVSMPMSARHRGVASRHRPGGRPAVPRPRYPADRPGHDHAELHRVQHPSPNWVRSTPADWPAACICTPPWLCPTRAGHRHLGPAILGAPRPGRPGPEEKESGNGSMASTPLGPPSMRPQAIGRSEAVPRDGPRGGCLRGHDGRRRRRDTRHHPCAQNRRVDDPLATATRRCEASRCSAGRPSRSTQRRVSPDGRRGWRCDRWP